MMYTVQMGSNGMTYITSFMEIGTGVQAVLRSYPSNLKGCNAGNTDRRDLLCTPLKWL
jgi:hypothetical protein